MSVLGSGAINFILPRRTEGFWSDKKRRPAGSAGTFKGLQRFSWAKSICHFAKPFFLAVLTLIFIVIALGRSPLRPASASLNICASFTPSLPKSMGADPRFRQQHCFEMKQIANVVNLDSLLSAFGLPGGERNLGDKHGKNKRTEACTAAQCAL